MIASNGLIDLRVGLIVGRLRFDRRRLQRLHLVTSLLATQTVDGIIYLSKYS